MSFPAIAESVALPIVITEFDQRRLRGLVNVLRQRGNIDQAYLEDLEMEIERADVVSPDEISSSVVTMNSTVEVEDVATGQTSQVTIVFPGMAHADNRCISVVAPMGAALLGARVGQHVRWQTPTRAREARVLRILFQPEAAGNFQL